MKNINDKILETGMFWLLISGTAKDKGNMTLPYTFFLAHSEHLNTKD